MDAVLRHELTRDLRHGLHAFFHDLRHGRGGPYITTVMGSGNCRSDGLPVSPPGEQPSFSSMVALNAPRSSQAAIDMTSRKCSVRGRLAQRGTKRLLLLALLMLLVCIKMVLSMHPNVPRMHNKCACSIKSHGLPKRCETVESQPITQHLAGEHHSLGHLPQSLSFCGLSTMSSNMNRFQPNLGDEVS